MESPFQGAGPSQPHQARYPGPQGLIVPPEQEVQVDPSQGMSQPGFANSAPLLKDNIAIHCRIGQETVQEIVARATEIFQLLRTLQPPNGTAAHVNAQEDKKLKLAESFKAITFLFGKLRHICEKVNYSSATMEYTHIEVDSLIPLKDETDARQDDRKTTDTVRAYSAEYNALVEETTIKNRQLKEIIDQLRTTIWDINTMLAMRKAFIDDYI